MNGWTGSNTDSFVPLHKMGLETSVFMSNSTGFSDGSPLEYSECLPFSALLTLNFRDKLNRDSTFTGLKDEIWIVIAYDIWGASEKAVTGTKIVNKR